MTLADLTGPGGYSRGNWYGYTLYANFAPVADRVSPADVLACLGAAWDLVRHLRPDGGTNEEGVYVRLTTRFPGARGPWSPAYGLRPGEYYESLVVPELPWRSDGTRGGTTTQKLDRNPSLYLPNQGYVVWSDPRYTGNSIVHEFGHSALRSWPDDTSGHSPDPRELMYGGVLADTPVWGPGQVMNVLANLGRVRSGVRLDVSGSNGRVMDGGRPAWPIPTARTPETTHDVTAGAVR